MTDGGIDFGTALGYLRAGMRVCRHGWNGKGMWLSLVEQWGALEKDTDANVPPDGFLSHDGQYYETYPWIGMKTADNKFVPWLASQTDILAYDWEIARWLTTEQLTD